MPTIESFCKIALSLPETEEKPHFHLQSIRYKNKIFATIWETENRVMLKLSLVDQSVFCSLDNEAFFPVPNAWGKKGATFVQLEKVNDEMFADAINCAYLQVNPNSK
jgi:predicted DNA-binding protein (MmcQ/YjbR family)